MRRKGVKGANGLRPFYPTLYPFYTSFERQPWAEARFSKCSCPVTCHRLPTNRIQADEPQNCKGMCRITGWRSPDGGLLRLRAGKPGRRFDSSQGSGDTCIKYCIKLNVILDASKVTCSMIGSFDAR